MMKITVSDMPFDAVAMDYTPLQEPQHFKETALIRGVATLEANNLPPNCAVRAEYDGTVYYGIADEFGNATLSHLGGVNDV